MREIKFRAWNKEKQIMVYNDEDGSSAYSALPPASCVQMVNYCLNSSYAPDKYIWMQFTGMTNRNGDEVYEGDIIQTEHGYGVIEYNSTMGKWECAFDFDIDDLYVYVDNGEVIGNIYENRDLLDGDDQAG